MHLYYHHVKLATRFQAETAGGAGGDTTGTVTATASDAEDDYMATRTPQFLAFIFAGMGIVFLNICLVSLIKFYMRRRLRLMEEAEAAAAAATIAANNLPSGGNNETLGGEYRPFTQEEIDMTVLDIYRAMDARYAAGMLAHHHPHNNMPHPGMLISQHALNAQYPTQTYSCWLAAAAHTATPGGTGDSIPTYSECCVVCLESLEPDHSIRALPCRHVFHTDCITPWLTTRQAACPLCKAKVLAPPPPAVFASMDQATRNNNMFYGDEYLPWDHGAHGDGEARSVVSRTWTTLADHEASVAGTVHLYPRRTGTGIPLTWTSRLRAMLPRCLTRW